ncbi:hypothetical protein V8C44DRAFT_4592 [Trichoderma aethiopicum]
MTTSCRNHSRVPFCGWRNAGNLLGLLGWPLSQRANDRRCLGQFQWLQVGVCVVLSMEIVAAKKLPLESDRPSFDYDAPQRTRSSRPLPTQNTAAASKSAAGESGATGILASLSGQGRRIRIHRRHDLWDANMVFDRYSKAQLVQMPLL